VNGLGQLTLAAYMNPPSRKILQLQLASQLGLRMPRTLIPLILPRRAPCAQAGCRQKIFKTFSCTHQIWREAQLLRETEMDMLEHVSLASGHLPRKCRSGRRSSHHRRGRPHLSSFDPRRGNGLRSRFPNEPRRGTDRALFLAAGIGRSTAGTNEAARTGIWRHRRPAHSRRRFAFLEVNTAGEFLFIEERTGLPIAAALANWLSRPGLPSRAFDQRNAAETTV